MQIDVIVSYIYPGAIKRDGRRKEEKTMNHGHRKRYKYREHSVTIWFNFFHSNIGNVSPIVLLVYDRQLLTYHRRSVPRLVFDH